MAGFFDPERKRRDLISLLAGPDATKEIGIGKPSALSSLLTGVPSPAVRRGLTARNTLLGLTSLEPAPAKIKRRAYFAFHYVDVMRVNVVRQTWKIDHPDSAAMRSFYDSSLWESRKQEGDDALKRLIREGVQNTSAVCVLAGTETWERRWVRYEIARAIIDGRGLLAVDINGIRHHETRAPHLPGINPLTVMGIGKVSIGLEYKYYLYEKVRRSYFGGYTWEWIRYVDYTDPVPRPRWLVDPLPGYISVLSDGAAYHDYAGSIGHKNIGTWIDLAASRAGR